MGRELREHDVREERQKKRETWVQAERQENECGIFADTSFPQQSVLLQHVLLSNVTELSPDKLQQVKFAQWPHAWSNNCSQNTANNPLSGFTVTFTDNHRAKSLIYCVLSIEFPSTVEGYPIPKMCIVTLQLNDPLQKVIRLRKNRQKLPSE